MPILHTFQSEEISIFLPIFFQCKANKIIFRFIPIYSFAEVQIFKLNYNLYLNHGIKGKFYI